MRAPISRNPPFYLVSSQNPSRAVRSSGRPHRLFGPFFDVMSILLFNITYLSPLRPTATRAMSGIAEIDVGDTNVEYAPRGRIRTSWPTLRGRYGRKN